MPVRTTRRAFYRPSARPTRSTGSWAAPPESKRGQHAAAGWSTFAARLGLVQDIACKSVGKAQALKLAAWTPTACSLLEALPPKGRAARADVAIPPADADDNETRRFLHGCASCWPASMRNPDRAQMDIPSMGMSHDYAAAIAEVVPTLSVWAPPSTARDYSKGITAAQNDSDFAISCGSSFLHAAFSFAAPHPHWLKIGTRGCSLHLATAIRTVVVPWSCRGAWCFSPITGRHYRDQP